MTRVLISAWVGSGNLGDELILRATLRLLAQHDVEVVVPSLDPDATEATHGVRSIGHLDPRATQRAITSADLVVFGGGGLVQDATSPWSPLYQGARPLVARLARTPVVGLGLGAEPLRSAHSRLAMRAALGRNLGLVARDQPSCDALSGLGLPGVVHAADLVLTLPRPTVSPVDRIVACLRSQPPSANVVPGRWRSDEDDAAPLVASLARALDAVSDRHGLPLRLVAMEGHRDVPFAERVLASMRVDARIVEPDLDGIVPEIASARLVISTRYHGGIVAALSGRPTILLGYAPKVRSLAADLPDSTVLLPNRPDAIGGLADAAARLLAPVSPGAAPVPAELPEPLRQRARRNASVLASALTHPQVQERAARRA